MPPQVRSRKNRDLDLKYTVHGHMNIKRHGRDVLDLPPGSFNIVDASEPIFNYRWFREMTLGTCCGYEMAVKVYHDIWTIGCYHCGYWEPLEAPAFPHPYVE